MDTSECRDLWQQMVSGRCCIVYTFNTAERANLVFAETRASRAPLSARGLAVLERLLTGSSAKAVAIDFALAQSTIAIEAKRSLNALGCCGSASRLPLPLVMLVHAARAGAPSALERTGPFEFQGRACQLLSAPIAGLAQILPPAVREVAQLHAQGSTHAEIAAHRCTSERTVANQLAIAFRRLGVSGRSGLLSYLALRSQPVESVFTAHAPRIDRPGSWPAYPRGSSTASEIQRSATT
jgi:DNA-binding NarL/FixJ family response regulator